MKNVNYEEFVEKFKPKKTTDDCYTPPIVYDAVLDWVRKNIIGDRPVVRPFYPGGDYENYDYPEGSVVVDNPPFSIFAKICDFYISRSIPFFLFAPGMTGIRDGVTFIGIGISIIYENGACVNSSFVTNMLGDLACTTEPTLYEAVKKANDENIKGMRKSLRKLSFPDNVLRSSEIDMMSRAGIMFSVKKSECRVVKRVSIHKKGEFGYSFLLSTRLTAEKLAAKKLAAEKLAAEKLAAEKLAAEKLQLNDACIEIIKILDEQDKT